MEKINMKAVTFSLLSGVTAIKKARTDYPSDWNIFPTAIYRTSSKPHFVDLNQEELQTSWQINIEIYGDKSLTDIGNDIMTKFRSIGFKGTCRDSNTAGLKRIIIDVSAIVDNTTKYVFEK